MQPSRRSGNVSLTAKQTKQRCHLPPPHGWLTRRLKTHWSQTRVAFSVLHCMQNPGSAPHAYRMKIGGRGSAFYWRKGRTLLRVFHTGSVECYCLDWVGDGGLITGNSSFSKAFSLRVATKNRNRGGRLCLFEKQRFATGCYGCACIASTACENMEMGQIPTEKRSSGYAVYRKRRFCLKLTLNKGLCRKSDIVKPTLRHQSWTLQSVRFPTECCLESAHA